MCILLDDFVVMFNDDGSGEQRPCKVSGQTKSGGLVANSKVMVTGKYNHKQSCYGYNIQLDL